MRQAKLYVHGYHCRQTLQGGWACVIDDGDRVREFSGTFDKTKKRRMTLIAMIRAMECISHLKPSTELIIETDCKRLSSALSGKMEKWQAKGWKLGAGQRLEDVDLWKKLCKLIGRFEGQIKLIETILPESLLGRAAHLSRSALSTDGAVRVYVDGSFLPKSSVGGWGVVLNDHEGLSHASGAMAMADNNLSELIAAIKAIEMTEMNSDVILYTDSQYVQNGARLLSDWKEGNWRAKGGGKVNHSGWWQDFDRVLQGRTVRIEWIKGHSGIEHNMTADRLAGEAAKKWSEGSAPASGR